MRSDVRSQVEGELHHPVLDFLVRGAEQISGPQESTQIILKGYLVNNADGSQIPYRAEFYVGPKADEMNRADKDG